MAEFLNLLVVRAERPTLLGVRIKFIMVWFAFSANVVVPNLDVFVDRFLRPIGDP